MSILTAEYSFDVAVAVREEEAYASGLSIGLEQGLTQGLSQGREEGISIGLERGVHQKALKTAKKLLARGDSPAEIADLLSLSVSQVQGLVENH